MASPRAQLAALCSRDPDKARHVAAGLDGDVQTFSTVEAMVAGGTVDAIFVNTPVVDHVRSCTAAIRAGCGVICEKPLAATTAEAAALLDASAAAGVRTVVNFTYRSVLGFRLTERILAQNGIGLPLHAEIALLQGHNFLPGYPRTSALLDSGVHLFDALAGLAAAAGMGRVARVCAAPMRHVDGSDYGWAFTAETSRGHVLSAAFSRSALGWRNGWRWSIYGQNGAVAAELDFDRAHVRLARGTPDRPLGEWRPVEPPPDLRADEARFAAFHLDRLVGALRGDEPFPGFAEAVAAQRVADAVAESAAAGRWTDVAPVR